MSAAMNELVKDLKEKQKQSKGLEKSIQKNVETWRRNVNVFFGNVKKWLSPLVRDKLVDISENPITIAEELATYDTSELVISFSPNNRIIKLVPKGTYIIGANGRIDLEAGFIKPIKFVLMSKRATSADDLIQIKEASASNAIAMNISWGGKGAEDTLVWKIAPNDISRGTFEELDDNAFANIIKKLVL